MPRRYHGRCLLSLRRDFGHTSLIVATGVTERRVSFVGREAELGSLDAFTKHADVHVVFVHGLAGIGKSALVRELLSRANGTAATYVDCRTVEPTERGILDVLGVRAVEELVGPHLLVLDHYEVFRLMDTWLRQVLVPALAPGSTIVFAGREAPVAGWFSLGSEFHSLPLGPLDDDDACALLERRGFAEAEAIRLNRIARGHPLALTLAAAGVAEHPQLRLEDAAATRLVAALARLYLEEVPDPVTRRSLEAASVVRRTTEPVLGAMLDGGETDTAMERLLELPFVTAGRDGLVVHDAVREAIASFLRGTNPVRHRKYRHAAWRELRSEVEHAPPSDLWRYTADMLYLVDNPVVREAFFPSGAQPLAVEPALADDATAVIELARKHDGADAAGLLERWWEEVPETFSVTRDRDGVVVGFFSLLDTEHMTPSLVDDPVVHAWSQHLREHPVPKGQVVLGLRRWLDVDHGELPCASQAACWLDVKRAYMALRPALRRIYVVVNDVPTYWPIVEKLGFRPISDAPVVLDGTPYASVALDFGPESVDGWLAGLVAAELGVSPEPALDEDAREISVHGEPVALTALEFGLFRHLREREGKAVSRAELLREVWGTDYTGGSNVVDAVVRSLRQKLGAAATVVETVRGSGYRLRSDWREQLS